MDLKGQLVNAYRDIVMGKWHITFSFADNVIPYLQGFYGKELDISIKQHRKKRSLDANAYYWQLLTKLAELLQVSKPYMHNYFLRKYGQIQYFDGTPAYIVVAATEESEKLVDESQTYHLLPTSQVKTGKDGILYRTYLMLRGSHSYDTREMSVLIDGLVQEAKENGIETLPPEELERMMKVYAEKDKTAAV